MRRLPPTASQMAPLLSNLAGTNSKLPLVSALLPGARRRALSSAPTFLKVATSRSEAHRSSVEADIRTRLLRSLPATPPPVVTDPMHQLVSAAPKTIAPALCLAACELVGGRGAAAMDVACAVDLMHAAAHARSRFLSLLGPRAKTKSSFPFPPGIQLMTVDALIPLGFEIVARSRCSDPSRLQRVTFEIAAAMGAAGVPAGLYMEANEAGNFVGNVCKKKDGRLSACAAACGAIVGGGSDEEVERLRRFGLYAGMMHGLLSADVAGKSEAADAFRSLAQSELEGFEEGKVREVWELMDRWYEEGTVPAAA